MSSQLSLLTIPRRPKAIARPALNYFGSKFTLRKWIQSHFPAHQDYLEPYGGGANCFLNKVLAPRETYNEINPTTFNYFRQLIDRPEELIAAIAATPATPEAYQVATKKDGVDSLELARRTFVEGLMSFRGAGGRWTSGCITEKYREERYPSGYITAHHLWPCRDRLKDVRLTSVPALDAIASASDGCLIYADPCYVHSVRAGKDNRHNPETSKSRAQYEFEMEDADHIELAKALCDHNGPVVVSGYPSDLYTEIFPAWQCVTKETHDISRNPKTEALWVNAIALEQLPELRNTKDQQTLLAL